MGHGGGATERCADGHRRRKLTVRGVQACLDKILALGLGDKGLQLGSGERVDEACLTHDEEQDLSASKRRKLVSLL